MSYFDSIQKPALLINEETARNNIRRMIAKARAQNIRFRPHFKTHQSAEIGEWYRAEGLQTITVSSLEMAEYFAAHGWTDITVAFPVNLREIDTINRLADRIHLELLVESPESVRFLQQHLTAAVDVWIKINVGTNRTGLPWDVPAPVVALAQVLNTCPQTRFKGLLTHAGHTYFVRGAAEVLPVYQASNQRIIGLRQAVIAAGLTGCQVSVGDTPGCVLSPDLGAVDEIRPGNFIFFDTHQLIQQVCLPEDVAVALACPVVAKHPERCEVVIYGGAIHLSKEFWDDGDRRVFGLLTLPQAEGWSKPVPGAYVRLLSQEHGVVVVPGPEFDAIEVGGLVCILPVHSCLTVQVMREYRTLHGRRITTLNSC